MIRRMMKSRGMRKFLGNKMAMVSSGIIAIYLLIALCIVFGAITREDARKRVLPNKQYGFLQAPNLEERVDRAKWFVRDLLPAGLDAPGGLAALPDPQQRIGGIGLAERRIVDLPPEQIDVMWAELKDAFQRLDDAWLDHDDLLFEIEDQRLLIEDMRAEGDPSEDIAEEQAFLDEMIEEEVTLLAEVREGIDDVEARLGEIMPIPSGLDGLVYRFRTFLGSDGQGRSISAMSFYGIKLAFQIGVVVGILSVVIGTLLGGAAGFFGGWVDHVVMWLVSVISSVPYLIWLLVLAYLFVGHDLLDNPAEHPEFQLVKLYVAMGFAFWVGTARVIRGEVMKIKELEYVQAATAIGFGRMYILIKHVIPNTAHLMFINFSLIFIGAIKSEVILSFLGLGVTGQPSWGSLISLGREDVQNFFFWSVLSATALMFGLVLAFNIVSDALQDAFDPKHVG